MSNHAQEERNSVTLAKMSKVKELIEWAPGSEITKGEKAKAKYGALSEFGRQIFPPEAICTIFCGGKKCKYCEPGDRPDGEMIIKGLYSAWVTDNILAMSRPSTELIQKYDMLEQFRKHDIKSVINLQIPGEHAGCGAPLKSEGFSYNPQDFMRHGVYFYNFGWPDYGTGSMGNLADMVRVMQFAVSEGKVAVHCHAGLGRTGLLIACYLIFSNRLDPDEVIQFVRSKRDGAIQTSGQVACIRAFYDYLKPLWIVFSLSSAHYPEFTLGDYLIRQKHLLHGYEARYLKYIPKILYKIFERLLVLAKRPTKPRKFKRNRDSVKLMKKAIPGAFNNETLSDSVSIKSTKCVTDPDDAKNNDSSESESNQQQDDTDTRPYQGSLWKRGVGEMFRNQTTASLNKRTPSVDKGVFWVAEALSLTDYSADTLSKVEEYKKILNDDNSAWDLLGEEPDPVVLAALLWDWLDHLQQPILTAQDLPHLLSSEQPLSGLHKLHKWTRHTIEYLFRSLARLAPLPDKLFVDVIQRCLSTLCHKNVRAEDDVMFETNVSASGGLVQRTSNTGEMSTSQSFRLLCVSVNLLENYMHQANQQ